HVCCVILFFFSSRRRHTRFSRDWSSDVCSSDLIALMGVMGPGFGNLILALVYKEWVTPSRIVRGEVLAAKNVEYVEAARAVGAQIGRASCRERVWVSVVGVA